MDRPDLEKQSRKRYWYGNQSKELKDAINQRRRQKYAASYGKRSRQNASFRQILQHVPAEPTFMATRPCCKYCGAKIFQHEPNGFCCADGSISLISNDFPVQLHQLFVSNTIESTNFRTYVRTYNNKFAFTSFGVKFDKDLCRRNKGIYTFRVQGQVYHYINDLLPQDGHPSYLQLYFYDTEHELENRIKDSGMLEPSIIEKLMNILKVNPYSIFFKSLSDIPDLANHVIHIRFDVNLDQRVYNSPSASQVAAIWIESDNPDQQKKRDIIVYNHSGGNHIVQHYFGCYDPLQYPLLFPFGESGWHQGIKKVKKGTIVQNIDATSTATQPPNNPDDFIRREQQVSVQKNKEPTVSCREYYAYKLQIRQTKQSILLLSGRLLHQFVVDMYVKIETSRLDYFRTKQQEIRSEVYQGIVDSISIGQTNGSQVGKRIILPASFIGGPRDMRKRYMEAMALVQRFGKPDIFLTMTCNPNWREILDELQPHEEVQNRPDLVARVFRAKLENLKDDLFKNQIFGKVAAYVYVIEHQKRGLPHAHFLLILERDWRIYAPEAFDEIVSAEIPSSNTNCHLHKVVVKHMMHGPCGELNPSNICMKKNGSCKNNYPKSFSSNTTVGNDCFPLYRRRDNGISVIVRGKHLDNRWVVPHNPYLLSKYDCHINVEIYSTIKAVKYLYKYIYKGHDRIALNVIAEEGNQQIDEIQQFQSGRWITPPEAMWRIYGFTINEMYPSVYSLHLHLENQHIVTFRGHEDLNNVYNSDSATKSMLTEFFSMNRIDEKARQLLYREFPEHFVWNQQQKIWTTRKKKSVIGRIVASNPLEGERYYLRILLNHIRGPLSYEHLRTVNGITATTFCEAANLYGLLQTDNSLEDCLEEASLYQMPNSLRRLFVTILVYCNPTNPRRLWERFEEDMSADYKKMNTIANVREAVLRNISLTLESMGKHINMFHLIDTDISFNNEELESREINDELQVQIPTEDVSASTFLNREQRQAYDLILQKLFSNQEAMFFIDGPGGTGKTFLYRALLAEVRSKKLIALATASSGVAASILPGGRTAHSRFKIPLDANRNSICSVSKQGGLAKLLRMTKLIIWDEAPMCKKQSIEALDRMLRDVNNKDSPFGGKVIVFGGDFRQVLPVIHKGTRQEQIDASLATSYLWPDLIKIRLTENMRARLDQEFSNYLLEIGNGTTPTTIEEKTNIPIEMLLPYINDVDSLDSLVDTVFGDIYSKSETFSEVIDRAILTPKNSSVDEINAMLIEKFPGNITRYYSFDETIEASEQGIMEDFLNTLTPNGVPPHELVLKQNCPIMLLRNINPSEGLSNGTRLICKNFNRNIIDAEIAVGHHKGNRVFIPRIPFTPNEDESNGFPFKRTQFPIRLSFAMTINKSQGQTLDFVGLYLPQPVFSHGQLYVALSRAKTSKSVKILIRPTTADNLPKGYTKNIVYKELLELANSS